MTDLTIEDVEEAVAVMRLNGVPTQASGRYLFKAVTGARIEAAARQAADAGLIDLHIDDVPYEPVAAPAPDGGDAAARAEAN